MIFQIVGKPRHKGLYCRLRQINKSYRLGQYSSPHQSLLVEKVRELFERCPLASVVPEDDQGDVFPLG